MIRFVQCATLAATATTGLAQSYVVHPVDTDPGIVTSAAAGVTADGRCSERRVLKAAAGPLGSSGGPG
jgi:hypothetical protein